MRTSTNQRGFSQIIIFVLVAIVIAAGVVSYRLLNAGATLSGDVGVNQGVPKKISSSKDLSQATTALDETAVDSAVNTDQLDADIAALL